MKRQSKLAAALKRWRQLEKWCGESGRDGSAFLTDKQGELLLFEGRPVLTSTFSMAWEARHRVERIAAEVGKEPPPREVSQLYAEWPSVEALTELFMLWGSMKWSDIDANLLEHFEAEPSRTATVTAIGGDAW